MIVTRDSRTSKKKKKKKKKRRPCEHFKRSQTERQRWVSPSRLKEPVELVVNMATKPWSVHIRRRMKSHPVRSAISVENVFTVARMNTGSTSFAKRNPMKKE